MAQGIMIFLLVLPPVAMPQPSASAGTKGGGVGETSNSFSPSLTLLDFDSSAAENNLERGDVAIGQNSLKLEAYPVTWKQQTGADVATGQNSLAPPAYPVTWEQQTVDDVAARQNSLKPAVYPVTWKSEAYPVTWKQQTQGAPDVAKAMPAYNHGLHVEPGMLFTRKSMFPGAILPKGTKFSGNGFPSPRRFVSRADADVIPFSYDQLDTILRMFQIPQGSKKADQVAATLRMCEAELPDPHTCATSQQAAAEFAASSLGVRTNELLAVTTVVHGKEDATSRYTVVPNGIVRISKAGGASLVPCHPMGYPYMVHYCHQPANVEALRVELMRLGDTAAAGSAITTIAIAVCHTNTTSWDGRYFEMLNATHGEEVCHFMPRNYVLWLPIADL